MAKTINEERLRWVKHIAEGSVSIGEVMEVFPYGKRTLERWLAAYRMGGVSALELGSKKYTCTSRVLILSAYKAIPCKACEVFPLTNKQT